MDQQLISGITYLFVALIIGVIATLFFVLNPLKPEDSQRIPVRYFTLLFFANSCFYITLLISPFISSLLAITLANIFFTTALHSLRLGLRWRANLSDTHLINDIYFWINLFIVLILNYSLYYFVDNSLEFRQVVSSLNLFLIYIFSTKYVFRDKAKPSAGEFRFQRILYVLIPLPFFVIVPNFLFTDVFLSQSLNFVWMILQTIILFGSLTLLLLSDVIDMHYKNSVTDPLTQLFNRRHFMDQASVLISSANRYCFPMSVIICDIDQFKKVNDGYGHNVGDKVIVAFAQLLKSKAREEDVTARFGGEEFIILLPQTDAQGAANLAERMRSAAENMVISADGIMLNVTASFGVATFDNTINIEDNIKHADEAMYRAKQAGRNQVNMYHQDEQV
ncbi:GGDEF domain-containing protein [Thalassotalea piscium]